jgi:maltose O-acetyltransferase
MLAGDLYLASDPELAANHLRAQSILATFNASRADEDDLRLQLLTGLFGHFGGGAVVKPNLRCDYGYNISIGARTFINYDSVLLDCNRIAIGEEAQIAPGVHSYTATHPLDAATPGVTIGENTVVGVGSVVTRSLPAGVIAAGSPCRVIRPAEIQPSGP